MKIEKVNGEKIFKKFLDEEFREYQYDKFIKYDTMRLKQIEEDLKNSKISLYCLFDDLKILGYICLKEEKDRDLTIKHILICPEFRGKGYGKMLLTYAEQIARTKGIKTITLASRPGRETFYFNCGYEGEGLLQCDKNKSEKEDIIEFFKEQKIDILRYNLFNNEVHQFIFDAKVITQSKNFFDHAMERGYYVQVLFRKNLELEEEKI